MALQRIGLFDYVEPIAGRDPYPAALARYVLAEQLGFDTAWVATHHFGEVGGVPSPLVFLTALAERTERIGLGTAVLTLSLENGLRAAEDAAVLEALHPGRLQLGLGTGHASAEGFRLLGREIDDRRANYETGSALLLKALEGEPLTSDGALLFPPAGGLRGRVWESPSTPEAARRAGARGNGLLLSRVAVGAPLQPSAPIQLAIVDAYREGAAAAGHQARVVVSRTVVVVEDPARRDVFVTAVADGYRDTWGGGHDLSDYTEQDLVELSNAHVGTAEKVAASLADDPVVAVSDELIIQNQPSYPTSDEIARSLELFATKVAPALGRPSRAVLAGR